MTLYELAQRFVGEVVELESGDSPFIQWCLESCSLGPNAPDETPWCSAFVNRLAWLLRLPRSKSAAARSWLKVGVPISEGEARSGAADIVVLKRNAADPGPDVLAFRGHVGLFAGFDDGGRVLILGGNQSDGVSIAPFPAARILGIRRLEAV